MLLDLKMDINKEYFGKAILDRAKSYRTVIPLTAIQPTLPYFLKFLLKDKPQGGIELSYSKFLKPSTLGLSADPKFNHYMYLVHDNFRANTIVLIDAKDTILAIQGGMSIKGPHIEIPPLWISYTTTLEQ